MARPITDESFEAFCQRQTWRINRRLNQRERQHTDPGGGYTLTIRGLKPAQIRLTETPEELLKKEGETGYRKANFTFLPGS